jgi:hypothetical protein
MAKHTYGVPYNLLKSFDVARVRESLLMSVRWQALTLNTVVAEPRLEATSDTHRKHPALAPRRRR